MAQVSIFWFLDIARSFHFLIFLPIVLSSKNNSTPICKSASGKIDACKSSLTYEEFRCKSL